MASTVGPWRKRENLSVPCLNFNVLRHRNVSELFGWFGDFSAGLWQVGLEGRERKTNIERHYQPSLSIFSTFSLVSASVSK